MPISCSRQHNATAPCAILRYYANLARAMDTEETRTAVSFTGRTSSAGSQPGSPR